MKKFRFTFTALLIMLMGTIAFLGLRQVPINAAPAEVGVIAEADVPDWIKGHELSVKAKFAQAYDDAEFTGDALGTVQSISFGNHKRVALFQVFGTVVDETTTYEGAILLNEREGTPLVVTDVYALANLQTLFETGSNNTNAILLDIVISEGETYYVTDRRNEDGIFHINEENAVEYLDKRIGVGTCSQKDPHSIFQRFLLIRLLSGDIMLLACCFRI